MICLPDINVWMALAAVRHVFHPVARRWFNTLNVTNRHAAAQLTLATFDGNMPPRADVARILLSPAS